MATKIQKILLYVFSAMFLIPEVLWSPILNFSYSILNSRNVPIILRNNFLISSDYRKLAIMTVLIQTIGLLISMYLIIRLKSNIYIKMSFFIIYLLIFILSSVVLIYLIATLNIGF